MAIFCYTIRMHANSSRALWLLYLIVFFFSLYIYILLYIQSSFISQYIAQEQIGTIYAAGACITALLFLVFPKVLKQAKDSTVLKFLIVGTAVCTVVLAFSQTPHILISTFILQQILIPLVFFTLDILIENQSTNSQTGHIRGMALTSANVALVISPLAAGYIVQSLGLQSVYSIALLFFIPLIFIFRRLNKVDIEPTSLHTSFFVALRSIWANKQRPIRYIFMVGLVLNIFYTWMVIYSPLYLQQLGFSWEQIGTMFSITLLPFLLLSFTLGTLADSRWGHKRTLIFGTLVMGCATLLFAYTHSTDVVTWTLILLLTRIGAVCIEVTSETYFFKHINPRDIYLLSLFRLNRPFSQILAPIFASLTLWYGGNTFSFFTLASIVLVSIVYSLKLPEKATSLAHTH